MSRRDMGRAAAIRPLRDVPGWDDEADVVVVGLGAAGACAALEACDTHADVLALERASGGGGTSAMSTGQIYLGGGTPIQEKCGFEDSPEESCILLVEARRARCAEGQRSFASRRGEQSRGDVRTKHGLDDLCRRRPLVGVAVAQPILDGVEVFPGVNQCEQSKEAADRQGAFVAQEVDQQLPPDACMRRLTRLRDLEA